MDRGQRQQLTTAPMKIMLPHPTNTGNRRSFPQCIVAATDRLQDSDFHSRRAKALWNSSLVCSDRACQGEQVQAFRCYEHNPPTSRRLVTNFRAAECPLLPKRILRCCRADEGRLFYTTFAGAKALAGREPTGEE